MKLARVIFAARRSAKFVTPAHFASVTGKILFTL